MGQPGAIRLTALKVSKEWDNDDTPKPDGYRYNSEKCQIWNWTKVLGYGGTYTKKRYILIATDYAIKMVEAEATRRDDAATVAKFMFESIITWYGCPLELVSD
ncbi:hypothetical protein AXG93_1967s1000 [Marchantia polymorpha subsp. ruderalis]|uniref:Integrase catalytic domain-containing protein n=1 Tax=Marchantia polymorpha subsp. ruderalis TaxID=1480154 RepID=A0A176WS22_MARPO|nr:hypothetical protein AXG93_1967s1000 [Marchantia polymorpha subsp. ruderalis]